MRPWLLDNYDINMIQISFNIKLRSTSGSLKVRILSSIGRTDLLSNTMLIALCHYNIHKTSSQGKEVKVISTSIIMVGVILTLQWSKRISFMLETVHYQAHYLLFSDLTWHPMLVFCFVFTFGDCHNFKPICMKGIHENSYSKSLESYDLY